MSLQAHRLLRTSIAAILLAIPARASLWIVDASGGGHFTDIPPAIVAASPGDVLLVLPGTYSGFTLDKRVHVIGQGANVNVGGSTSIQNLTTTGACAISGLTLGILSVENCTAPIVLDGLTLQAWFRIAACGDVRILRSSITGHDGNGSWPSFHYEPGGPGIDVDGARVELVECTVIGGLGSSYLWCECCPNGLPGGHAIDAKNVSDIHVYCSGVRGGNGGEAHPDLMCYGDFGGNGGNGLVARSGTMCLIAGQSQHFLKGGSGGYGHWGSNGENGVGLDLSGSDTWARYSGVTIDSMTGAGTFVPVQPSDPTLRITGTPHAGQILTFVVNAEPGTSVDLILGRQATVIATPGLAEDQLVLRNRLFHLGVVPSTGVVQLDFPVPATLPVGFVFFAQAQVIFSPTDARYTNSVPLLVR